MNNGNNLHMQNSKINQNKKDEEDYNYNVFIIYINLYNLSK